ncbi:unknown [Firmicutes bacterium CAG:882]|nr:unknown [Firmicutes bacterium CAG:882]
MGVQEAIEILRDEQKLLINTIAVYNSDYLGLSEAKKRELTMINKKRIEAINMAIEALGGRKDEV